MASVHRTAVVVGNEHGMLPTMYLMGTWARGKHGTIGTITWLAVFEHNYQPRIYRYNEDVTILQVGDSELDFNHSPGAFSIW